MKTEPHGSTCRQRKAEAAAAGSALFGGGAKVAGTAVTLGNMDGEIGGLTISDPPTQAGGRALRDKAEELTDGVRALSTLVHALRGGARRRGDG